MFVKIKCPDCGSLHFADVEIKGLENRAFNDSGECIQFILDKIQVRGVMSHADMLGNM